LDLLCEPDAAVAAAPPLVPVAGFDDDPDKNLFFSEP